MQLKIHIKKYCKITMGTYLIELTLKVFLVINNYEKGYLKNICLAFNKPVHLSSLYVCEVTAWFQKCTTSIG